MEMIKNDQYLTCNLPHSLPILHVPHVEDGNATEIRN